VAFLIAVFHFLMPWVFVCLHVPETSTAVADRAEFHIPDAAVGCSLSHFYRLTIMVLLLKFMESKERID